MSNEHWRPVVGFEGLYEVSDQGRVRNKHGQLLRICIEAASAISEPCTAWCWRPLSLCARKVWNVGT
jgi:hypothetical protein